MKKIHKIHGKDAILAGRIKVLSDLYNDIPKKAVAEGMGIHENTLPKRKLGNFTIDDLLQLGEALETPDPLYFVKMVALERVEQRKKLSKKKSQ